MILKVKLPYSHEKMTAVKPGSHNQCTSQESSIIDRSPEKATLKEPVGVSFVGISIYICCFRTGLKLCSNIAFALRYSQEMQKVYIAIGFKPKSSKEMLPKYSFKRNACPLCNPSTGVDANCWIRNTF